MNVLLTKVYKYLNGYFPDLMNEFFYIHPNHFNLRRFNVFATDNSRKKYLLNSSVYRPNQPWQTLRSEIQRMWIIATPFREKIKTWRYDRR